MVNTQEKTATRMVENETFTVAPAASEVGWWRQVYLRRLYFLMPFLFLGSTTLGYDGSVLNGLQTMTTWQNCKNPNTIHITVTDLYAVFHNPKSAKLGILGAMPGFGGLASLPFAPYIADKLGRRNGTAIGCLFVILGALIQSFPPASNPVPMYLAGRFFVGFGSTISNATCPLLITEIAHPQHRGKVTTIYNTVWYLGAIVAAWTTFGTLTTLVGDIQWRLPTGLQCLMPGIQLIALYLIPESPRWLISRGRNEEARAFIVKYHGNNDPEDEFAKWEFSEISETLRLEEEAAASNGWHEMIRTPGNRKRCMLIIATAIFSQCSGNGLVSYYLASILDTIGITE